MLRFAAEGVNAQMTMIARARSCWIAVGLMLAAAVPATGFPDEERETLSGVLALRVVVDIEGDLDGEDALASRLQRDVEAALRRRGIAILEEAEWRKTPGRPVLHVELTVDTGGAGADIYALTLELEQDVTLAREPTRRTVATTWSAPTRIGVVRGKDTAPISEAARKAVDAFLAAHGEVNRKR